MSRDPIDDALGFLARWVITFAILVALVLLATSCRPKCPKCVAPPPPPPVVTVVRPPPCVLPELPEPIVGLGVPDAQRDGYFVPRQRWAELGGYQAGVIEWIRAANDCLTVREAKP